MTTPLSPPTRTETTTVRVVRGADGRPRTVVRGGAFRGLPLAVGRTSVRLAMVPERALLLRGDHVAIDVAVESGLGLHLQDTTGTVAYDMRGGAASWLLDARVGVGARLVLDTLPWVSSAGSRTTRRTDVSLAAGAVLLARETLVLGRSGEGAGGLVSGTRIAREGAALLVEELDAAHLAPHRVLDTILSVGATLPVVDPPALPGGPLRLASGDLMWRALGQQAHRAARLLDPVWAALQAPQASVDTSDVSASESRVGTTKR